MSEDIRPHQILRTLADGNHWSSEGYCEVCGGETYTVDNNSNGQRYYSSASKPGTHTADCPWLQAQQWVEERYGSGHVAVTGTTDTAAT
jgi:hypothetical protein